MAQPLSRQWEEQAGDPDYEQDDSELQHRSFLAGLDDDDGGDRSGQKNGGGTKADQRMLARGEVAGAFSGSA
ncbi:MAG: hypothetical protein WD066_11240 [Planctomycetaceae bacterium]